MKNDASLPPDVREILERAESPEPPPGLEDRIWSDIGKTWPAPAPAAPSTGALHRALGKWGLLSTVAALAVGGAGGAWVCGAIDARTTPAPAPALTAPAAVPIASTTTSVAIDAGTDIAIPKPPRAAPAVSSSTKATRDRALAEEQNLLETARSAILRREPHLALPPLREHAARFPHGQLREERDGLWVQALANDGDLAGARAKADAFRRDYPQSLLLPAVEEAVKPAP